MCSVPPAGLVPIITPPLKDLKLLSLLYEVRNAPGFHSYIRFICIERTTATLLPCKVMFLEPHGVKGTYLYYIMVDDPEFKLVHRNGYINVFTSLHLKNRKITTGCVSNNDIEVPGEFVLKKGDYLIVSVKAHAVGAYKCVAIDDCEMTAGIQYEVNGTTLPGTFTINTTDLEYTRNIFAIMDLPGAESGVIHREFHWQYDNMTESLLPQGIVEAGTDRFLETYMEYVYLSPGDILFLTGTYRKITDKYEGIALGVVTFYNDIHELHDFVRYKDTTEAVTFMMSASYRACIVTTVDESYVIPGAPKPDIFMEPVFFNMCLQHIEMHARTLSPIAKSV